MKRPLHEILAESYIAAVAIALLLLWSVDAALWAARDTVYSAAEFIVTAVAIQGIPYSSHIWTIRDRMMFFRTGYGLGNASVDLVAAWLLSHWVYGAGPFRSLIRCRHGLARRK